MTSLLPEVPLIPGAHGGDGHLLAQHLGCTVEEILDLSASLNPLAPSVLPVLSKHLESVVRYPKDHGDRARNALAEALHVDPERVVLTNGGSEAIAAVAHLYPAGWAASFDFSLYRRHLTTLEPAGKRWMSDPHNPTGALAGANEQAFVRDEAFYLLATGAWTRHDPDTYVVGSLTKTFACPGIRIGYVIAPTGSEAQAVTNVVPEWSVNSLALAALPELMDSADPQGWASGIAELRQQLVTLLESHGHGVTKGAANYVWIPNAPNLRTQLLPHGILIRSGASFGQPDAVRIAVPNAVNLQRLAHALTLQGNP